MQAQQVKAGQQYYSVDGVAKVWQVEEIFGDDYKSFVGKYAGEEYFIHPEEIGDAILALCSGMLDAMSGQVIMVDKGIAFADSLMRLLEKREELGM